MIPRYAPTYRYQDILAAYRLSAAGNASAQLTARLAELHQVKHVFLTSTAREGMYLILKALGRPGGVLMPAYNCIVVPEAVSYAGYTPVFADIDYASLNLTAARLEQALTPDIRAVFATHLFGVPCDLDAIRRVLQNRDILFIEDAAPALGASYCGRLVGSFGDAAVVSFHATKVISAEVGGALLTNDDALAEKISRFYKDAALSGGSAVKAVKALGRKTVTRPWLYGAAQFAYRVLRSEAMYEVVHTDQDMPSGFPARCSEFDAALILAQLDRLEWNVGRRRKIAQIYQAVLAGHPLLSIPTLPAGSEPAWMQFQLIANDKGTFYKYMQRHGIDIAWTYRYSCPDSYNLSGFDNAQLAARTVVGLPTYPTLSDKQAARIADIAKGYTG